MSTASPPDSEIAAEYVLRVLADDSHRAAAIRCATDPAFAAEVRYWEDRLTPLTEELAEIAPDPATKDQLMARLFGQDTSHVAVGGALVWQILAGLGFAAAAVIAFLAFTPQPTTPVAREITLRYVAELTAADESTRMFAVLQPETGTVDISWTARNQPLSREIQLWALVDGTTPVSIAVLPPGRMATVQLPAELADQVDGMVLAISDEPLGGSPLDEPSGEIIATAPISQI